MKFKDYYATLGVERTAKLDEITRAYRRSARKYHPDVSKETDAEAKFKEVSEAYKVLKDPEQRAAYDEVGAHNKAGEEFHPPPNWNGGFEFSGRSSDPVSDFDRSEFFEALFGRQPGARHGAPRAAGHDRHAKVQIDLADAYQGARRRFSLRVPRRDAAENVTFHPQELQVSIPKGIRSGQHLRLAGQGEPGLGAAGAGDLYLEIEFAPHAQFRVEGADVYVEVPLAPWEAALGASVGVSLPDGQVQLTVPAGSQSGRKLRLKGKGLPGATPGDLYAMLSVMVPPADTTSAQEAYRVMKQSFSDFNPRQTPET